MVKKKINIWMCPRCSRILDNEDSPEVKEEKHRLVCPGVSKEL